MIHKQVGWLSALGWQAAVAVTAYGAANIILQMAAIDNPGYVPTPWSAFASSGRSGNSHVPSADKDGDCRQGTLATMAIVVFSVLCNTFGAKYLPTFESMILVLHLVGFVAILVPLWVLAPKVRSNILLCPTPAEETPDNCCQGLH